MYHRRMKRNVGTRNLLMMALQTVKEEKWKKLHKTDLMIQMLKTPMLLMIVKLNIHDHLKLVVSTLLIQGVTESILKLKEKEL